MMILFLKWMTVRDEPFMSRRNMQAPVSVAETRTQQNIGVCSQKVRKKLQRGCSLKPLHAMEESSCLHDVSGAVLLPIR